MYEWIKGRRHYLPENKVKNYMYQILTSVDHMHRNGIFHRDIKPENVLLMDDALKLADFGSCRGIYSKQPYTEYISTRWYRAPECLLTDGYYNYKMDIWGVGCVWFEVLALFPLFPGNNELDQVNKIHNILGTPGADILEQFQKKASHMDFNFATKEGTGIDKLIPHVSAPARELINQLLLYDSEKRISARTALKSAYFADLEAAEKPSRGPAVSHSPTFSNHEAENTSVDRKGNTQKLSFPEIAKTNTDMQVGAKKQLPTIKRRSFVPENKFKTNPSIKSIQNQEFKNGSIQQKKIQIEPRKAFVSPYSKKTFYKSYF